MRLEAKQVAILRNPVTHEIVGRLYLWESGEVDSMWFDAELADAIVEPLAGENPDWANWTLGDNIEMED